MGCEAGTLWLVGGGLSASSPPGHSGVEAALLRKDNVYSCQRARQESQRSKGSPKACGSFGRAHTSCAPGSSSHPTQQGLYWPFQHGTAWNSVKNLDARQPLALQYSLCS